MGLRMTPIQASQTVGSILAPPAASPSSAAPPVSARPKPRPQTLGGAVDDRGGKFQQLMENPRFKAFMLNVAANLLMGNPIGPALAMGIKGMGRSEQILGDLQRQAAEDALKLQKIGGVGGGRGGGRGSGGGEGSSLGVDPNSKEYKKILEDSVERLREEGDPTMSEVELLGLAHLQTMARLGSPDELEAYESLSDSPSVRTQMLRDFARGPKHGVESLNRMIEANTPRNEPPPKVEEPSRPREPGILPPDIQVTPEFGAPRNVIPGMPNIPALAPPLAGGVPSAIPTLPGVGPGAIPGVSSDPRTHRLPGDRGKFPSLRSPPSPAQGVPTLEETLGKILFGRM